MAAWPAAERGVRDVVDRQAGSEAARRAVRCEGDVRLRRPAVVVELEPEAGMAAGRLSQRPGEWFHAVMPDAEVSRFDEESVSTDVVIDGRQLVVIARDAHRHAWQREAIDALTARSPDAIVLEIGLPHWRPPGAAGVVATYGAARVNIEAAAAALADRP